MPKNAKFGRKVAHLRCDSATLLVIAAVGESPVQNALLSYLPPGLQPLGQNTLSHKPFDISL